MVRPLWFMSDMAEQYYEKKIIYCDPKKRPADRQVLDKVTAFIRCRLRDTTAWKVTAPTDIPLQGNSDDCGVFVCMVSCCLYILKWCT